MSVKCGNCHDHHESVAAVKDCYALTQHEEQETKSEQAAERRVEQWYEERGGAEDDPIEREKWAFEDMERKYNADVQAAERADDERAYASKPDAVLFDSEEEEADARLNAMTGSHGRDMASTPQVDYIMDLLDGTGKSAQREWPDQLSRTDVENMERRQATKLLDGLKAAPKRGGSAEPITAGLYRKRDGRIIRVYAGQRSGNMLAKELVFIGLQTTTQADIDKGLPLTWEKWSYRYLGIARIHLGVDCRRLTVEEAKQWGKKSSTCCRCARRLDVPESVDAGIGPVCAGKDDWS